MSLVLDARHVTVLQILRLVRIKPGVRHEQHTIMHLLGVPFVVIVERFARVGVRRLIELRLHCQIKFTYKGKVEIGRVDGIVPEKWKSGDHTPPMLYVVQGLV
jgi:hypothetical protein